MMLIFVSQCHKNSLKITRRILDSYANRIGERTWQTVMTQEGLSAVKTRLAKTARKSTAVACHRIHGTSRSELLWIVGNKREFDAAGNVPVHRTSRDLMKVQDENDWHDLELIKVLVALSALFHDFGKSWDHFQNMLKDAKKKDPIRHEWISLLLFKAWVQGKTDEQWLEELAALNEQTVAQREKFAKQLIKSAKPVKEAEDYPFEKGLSTFATWVAWLIVTHHKLPGERLKYGDIPAFSQIKKPASQAAVLETITRTMGYVKQSVEPTWKFSQHLPLLSDAWCKEAARWARKAQGNLASIAEKASHERLMLSLARLGLMVGDHHYSSKDANPRWKTDLLLDANTHKDKVTGQSIPKQKLDEHLVGVMESALKATHLLPYLETGLPQVSELRALRKPAKGKFAWQNKAVEALSDWRNNHPLEQNGFFAINMASTGYGKTFANAKIMGALSANQSLRYNLALGLRTLTLQTGDEYRSKLQLDNTQMAVLVGSSAIRFLHEQSHIEKQVQLELNEELEEQSGSASAAELETSFDIDIALGEAVDDKFSTVLKNSPKARQLLYAPVVVCTIDHLMPATESVAGGKHILPTLRLMSADLVIDEVDDFNQEDMPAIARLVHLAGMLGRKVMISSATIPPAIAEGLLQAYQAGWQLFAKSRRRQSSVAVFWVDEFNTQINFISETQAFDSQHQHFIQQRLKRLAEQVAQRKAFIPIMQRSNVDKTELEQVWFGQVLQSVLTLHQAHAEWDETSSKHFSMGVVRVANVDPCIQLTRYLLACDLPDDIDIRVMPYHSRQVLLLRSEQEKHLDTVLNRKDGRQPQNNSIIRQRLLQSKKTQLIFILVATPVTEVGRDFCLDWAVIEPSSMRSIIQMAGRVRRHRPVSALASPNIHLLAYNLKGFTQTNPNLAVFRHPGFESKTYPLVSHCLKDLVDESALAKKVDASARIQAANPLQATQCLADLEHQALHDILLKADFSPKAVQGWLHSAFYFTRFAQQQSPFRASEPETDFVLYVEDEELVIRFAPDRSLKEKQLGKVVAHVHLTELEPSLKQRLWLSLDYASLLDEKRELLGRSLRGICEYLGTFSLPDREGEQNFDFNSYLGFLRILK